MKTHDAGNVHEFTRTLDRDPVQATIFGAQHCGITARRKMTFDHGLAHLAVGEYPNGSLRFVFWPAKDAAACQRAQ
ncbi:MAG: hypothetical protein ACLPYS_17025 [Vulcanimicrobiaceae bacterium]